MKKTLLLAGVACLVSFAASAQEYRPYVGLDYAYDKADFKNEAKGLKDGFNSGIINAGTRFGDYMGLEAFYQMSGDRKTHGEDFNVKTSFEAYGVDAYGYMPLGCDKTFELLASAGLANYDIEIKGEEEKEDKSHMGYRFGLGAQYNITENVAARIMGRYNYLGMSQLDNFQEVTAGVRYTF